MDIDPIRYTEPTLHKNSNPMMPDTDSSQNSPSSPELSPSQEASSPSERLPLEDLYPNCFDWSKPKPLKIGIHHDIIADGYDRVRVRRALGAYCGRPSYRRAMQVGAIRTDLNGQPAGVVTEQDVELTKISFQKHRTSADSPMPPSDTPIPRENLVPGRLGVSVRFSELPEIQPLADGMKIGIPTQEAVVWADLNSESWYQLEQAAKDWPQWLAIISGALDSLEDGKLILRTPTLRVFEKKD